MSAQTKVYGASDDLIEFDGEFSGEVGCYGTSYREQGVLVVISDGSVLEVKYCGRTGGVWEVKVHRKGSLFQRLDICDDPEAPPYSDVAHFNPGVKWAYAVTGEWEAVS